MSATKKLRTDDESSPRLANANTGNLARLYTFAPGNWTPIDYISTIYPILPDVGWSFVRKVFSFDKSKEACYFSNLSTENSGVCEPFQGFQDHTICKTRSLLVIPQPDGFRFLFLRRKQEDDAQRISDMSFCPLTLHLELATGSGYKWSIQVNCFPGVTSNFDPKELKSGKNIGYMVYYGVVDKTNPQWSEELGEFLECITTGKLPTLEIKGVKELIELPKPFRLTPQTVITHCRLMDKDGKEHSCHRELLAAQCPPLLKKLEESPSKAGMKVKGGSATVGILLHHFYYPETRLPSIANVKVAYELMKVALKLEIPKLFAIAVNYLIEKLDLVNSTQLMELYVFIHPLKFKIQILLKLWKVLFIKIQARILEDGKNSQFEKGASFLNFNSFMGDGYFRVVLLEKLCRDMKEGGDLDEIMEPPSLNHCMEEEVTQQVKVEMVLNRFKDYVINRMSSKLKANQIKF